MYTDEIIESVGGFGRFQIAMLGMIFGVKMVIAWSMIMMSFAGVAPDWWCTPHGVDPYNVSYRDNTTFQQCHGVDNSSCSYAYSDEMNTVINQWNLVCDKDTVGATLTSIQMIGVMVGAFVGGQSADVIGRKKTYYLSMLLHGVSNLVAAFSVSWQMFATLRFFIGCGIGIYLSTSYPYAMEFVGTKWRSVCSSLPIWTTGVGCMALATWLQPDWYYQHIINAALHIPFFLGWFFVPESLRWLTVQGRLGEAEEVVDQMGRYNRRQKSPNTAQLLKQVAEEEKILRASGTKYTYLDLYKGWSMFRKSVVIQFLWACMSLVYYGLSFGVGTLSGNLYLNIFLMGIVELPGTCLLFLVANKIGRRWTSFVYFGAASISAFAIPVVSIYVDADKQGSIITGLALVCKLGIGVGWGAVQILSSETYPTVIRNLGFGAANTTSRIGGIISPYIFSGKKGDVFVPFMVVGSTMAVCAGLAMLLEETTGRPLGDTMVVKGDNSKANKTPDTDSNVHNPEKQTDSLSSCSSTKL
ncbi:organic cation transporter protein-like [Haliotis rufescens]|uniref:organic cation transporter protein-like n=1 Tax=Haliotis rufescens TaxID=6454 RepID=UPI00201F432A|nr:organic cation transporter protein-like [Haliotis rufescens]